MGLSVVDLPQFCRGVIVWSKGRRRENGGRRQEDGDRRTETGGRKQEKGDGRLEDGSQVFVTGEIDERTDWSEALDEIDVVVHLAARVHVMDDVADDPLAEFRKVNTAGTLNLARQAAAAGVKRFIFISSIKVNGERTGDGRREDGERRAAFSEKDVACPQDAYAVSKWEAEQGLMGNTETGDRRTEDGEGRKGRRETGDGRTENGGCYHSAASGLWAWG